MVLLPAPTVAGGGAAGGGAAAAGCASGGSSAAGGGPSGAAGGIQLVAGAPREPAGVWRIRFRKTLQLIVWLRSRIPAMSQPPNLLDPRANRPSLGSYKGAIMPSGNDPARSRCRYRLYVDLAVWIKVSSSPAVHH